MTTRRNEPTRRRPFIGVTLDPETVDAIDAHAADLAGATGIPSRSRAIDDLVRIAVERKPRSKPKD